MNQTEAGLKRGGGERGLTGSGVSLACSLSNSIWSTIWSPIYLKTTHLAEQSVCVLKAAVLLQCSFHLTLSPLSEHVPCNKEKDAQKYYIIKKNINNIPHTDQASDKWAVPVLQLSLLLYKGHVQMKPDQFTEVKNNTFSL